MILVGGAVLAVSCGGGSASPSGAQAPVSGGPDILGTATSTQVSCSSVGAPDLVHNGVCYSVTVTCPEVLDETISVKVNQPTGASKGTVLWVIGGGGDNWYESWFQQGALAVQTVLDAGYTTAQLDFNIPISGTSQRFIGWLTGPGGPRRLSCRYATAAQWVHDNATLHTASTPFCATGQSGGSGANAYAISHYNLDSIFTFVELTGGPPFGRIDHGCICNQPSLQTPCGRVINECYEGEANQFLDPSFGNTTCSQAEGTGSTANANTFLASSILSGDGEKLSFPNTGVHFVYGGMDSSPGPSQGLDYINAITTKGSAPTVSCVPDAAHQVADVVDGALQIADDIIAGCQ